MKKILSCLGILFFALGFSAHAAETIGVEWNDTPLTFSEAVPLEQDGRTYLPFRTLFEAMGAEVSWNPASKTVSAMRNDRTVSFVLGEATLSIEEKDTVTTQTIDALPFAKDGRTYVPVRFAAQAFDAAVVWDADTRTVRIADFAPLLDEYDGTFTLLQTMLDRAADAFPAEPHQITGSYTLSSTAQTAMGSLPFEMTGSLTGSEDGIAANFSGTCQTNLDLIRQAIFKNEGAVLDSRINALLARFENFSFRAILNYDTNTQYLRSENLTELGFVLDAGGWTESELPLYSHPLPKDAKTYLQKLVAASAFTGSNGVVAAMQTLLDGLSDTAETAQAGILSSPSATLTLQGDKLTLETRPQPGISRIETWQEARRSFILTTDTESATTVLTCELLLSPGGDAVLHMPTVS